MTLDDAFGLATPQSGRSWRTRTRQQQRDHLLRRLGEQFTGSRHAKATAVADALRRYQATGWRHERNLDELTQSVPELRKLMHAILRLDPSAPTGWRRLHEILGETDICREHGDLVAKDDGYSERASEDLA